MRCSWIRNIRMICRAQKERAWLVVSCFWCFSVASFMVIRVGPDYYAYKSFEADVKTEASRAGANFLDDETILRNVIDLARKNEIRLKEENVKMSDSPAGFY